MEAYRLLGIFVERAGVQVCHSEERSDVGISCSSLRIRRSLPVIQPDTARLHPKGTSSRFALRAPRRLCLLAMTRQVVPWCTSALLPLNSPVQGAH